MSGTLVITFLRDEDFKGCSIEVTARIEDEFIGEFYEPFSSLLLGIGFAQSNVDELMPFNEESLEDRVNAYVEKLAEANEQENAVQE